jgi:hypothetical protein
MERQVWRLAKRRLECSPQVDKVKFTREMKKMATEGHCRGSKRSHNRGKKDCQSQMA